MLRFASRYGLQLVCRLPRSGIGRFSTSSVCQRERHILDKKEKNNRVRARLEKRIKTPEELFAEAANVDVKKVKKQYEERKDVRYVQPNKVWLDTVLPQMPQKENFSYQDNSVTRKQVREQLEAKFGKDLKPTSWKDFYYTELDVGDVVDLSGSFEFSCLAVVAKLPSPPEDTRYTLINQYGELQYVSRFQMGFRIPRMFPKEWFQDSVMNEADFIDGTDIPPIGKPKAKIEDDADRSRMFDSAIAKATVGGNNKMKCFIAPSILSGIISKELNRLVSDSWDLLPQINLKLEVLHNVLQCSEGPVHHSFTQLFEAVQATDLNSMVNDMVSRDINKVNRTYKKLLERLSFRLSVDNQFDKVTLGRTVNGNVDMESQIPVESLYAVVLGLRKNNQLFQFDSHSSSPNYVTVVPLAALVKFSRMAKYYKSRDVAFGELSSYITEKVEGEEDLPDVPQYYSEFIELIKRYMAGSIRDNVLESFVFKVIRSLPLYKDEDITRSTVYDLLLRLGEISNSEDPFKWWYNMMFPGSGVSGKADLEQQFYQSITSENLQDFVDLSQDAVRERENIDDVIYCIDSADALEIDDGVSVCEIAPDEYVVSSYIANPSSYIGPKTMISRIAFERGVSLYLPDINGVQSLSMLPTAFSKQVQLGVPNEERRVTRISFDVNLQTGQVDLMTKSGCIGFGIASKFVQIDYNSVGEVLAGHEKSAEILSKVSKRTGIDSDKLKSDLLKLHEISDLLAEKAKNAGRNNTFDQFTVKREISGISTDSNNQIQMKFKESDDSSLLSSAPSASESLVSQIMVMSNRVAGTFFAHNNIPAIFRVQNKLPMAKSVADELERLLRKGDKMTFRDVSLLREYTTSSSVAPFSMRHTSLGVDHYATVTSPLRRFWDFVNHWQLENFLTRGVPLFSQKQINYLTVILKFKDELNRVINRRMRGFYTFKVLTQQPRDTQYRCIVTKKPSEDGLIEVAMLDYGVRSILQTSWYALSGRTEKEDKKVGLLKDIEIGDIIEDATIQDINLLDGSIVLRSDSH